MRRILISLGSALLLSAALSVSAFAQDDTNTNTQTASNSATVTQSVAAMSGNAEASYGSSAYSGDVYAYTSAKIQQRNVQIAVNLNDIFVQLGGGLAE